MVLSLRRSADGVYFDSVKNAHRVPVLSLRYERYSRCAPLGIVCALQRYSACDIISQFPEIAKDTNHDGIIWKPSGSIDKASEFVAFDANQAKSASTDPRTANNGRYSRFNDDIQEVTVETPDGKVEVLGFVDKDDNIHLDRRAISPEHPIHEYTHVWDRYVAKKNPEFWKTGVEIFKQTSEWQNVLNDPNYGQKWKAMKNMTDSKLESLIASEVHARLTGRRGKMLLENLAKEKGKEGVLAKLKQWLLDFWINLKSAFTPWSDKELQELRDLAAKDIDMAISKLSDMTLQDFVNKVNPITAQVKVSTITPANLRSDSTHQPSEPMHYDYSNLFNAPTSEEVEYEDVYKKWKSDSSKGNPSRRFYLRGKKDKGYFEVVKDQEGDYYSVHFKPTDKDNPNAFTKEEKELLFQAVADAVPVDAHLSTWGELSKGGISGLICLPSMKTLVSRRILPQGTS